MRDYKVGDTVEIYRQSGLLDKKIGETGIISKTNKELCILMPDRVQVKNSISDDDFRVFIIQDMRPKYWCVKRPKDYQTNTVWKRVIKHIRKIYDWSGNGDCFYGYDGGGSFRGTQCRNKVQEFKNNAFELTLEEWNNFDYDGQSTKIEATLPGYGWHYGTAGTINNESITVIPWDAKNLKPGDKAIITGTSGHHRFAVGTQVTIKSIKNTFSSSLNYALYEVEEPSAWLIRSTDLGDPAQYLIQYNQQTNKLNMEPVLIKRRDLVSLNDRTKFASCSECRAALDHYLNLAKYSTDDSTWLIEQRHLDMIPRLSSEQRKILEEYIKLPESRTYKMGDTFKTKSGHTVMITKSGTHPMFQLTWMDGDNSLRGNCNGAVKVEKSSKITEQELKLMAQTFYSELIKI